MNIKITLKKIDFDVNQLADSIIEKTLEDMGEESLDKIAESRYNQELFYEVILDSLSDIYGCYGDLSLSYSSDALYRGAYRPEVLYMKEILIENISSYFEEGFNKKNLISSLKEIKETFPTEKLWIDQSVINNVLINYNFKI